LSIDLNTDYRIGAWPMHVGFISAKVIVEENLYIPCKRTTTKVLFASEAHATYVGLSTFLQATTSTKIGAML
jgi:hypothetical protein